MSQKTSNKEGTAFMLVLVVVGTLYLAHKVTLGAVRMARNRLSEGLDSGPELMAK